MEINFPKIEKKILRFWKKNRIFEKSIERRRRAKDFIFYEGPPTANAVPGIHHVLSRVFKDIICRYKTMQGFKVLRKAGWDTHGLPVELEIEKKLGLKNKKEIEDYGIASFNRKCKESVWKYKRDWEKLTERIGFWLDMENPYVTYETDYIESLWWILKEIWKKKLLYQDFKVTAYCPRCGTSLSSHEVAQGYQKIKEPTIYIKFKILNPEFKDTSLLVWTTTPWTLPGNVAIAVNENFIYSKIKTQNSTIRQGSGLMLSEVEASKIKNEYLILAKERLSVLNSDYEALEEFKGKDLVGLRYEALYPSDEETLKTAYKVVSGDFVSLEEGTGLVHIAPAFGEEDMELIKTQNSKLKSQKKPEFPILLTVDEEGRFTLGIKKWARMFVKDADPLIIEDLKQRDLLFKEELYEHDYPFCWRCHTPLLYYAKKSWFIRMTRVKNNLIKNNQKINWIPAHLKEGRFGEWLREIKDWSLSRERYWGTPLPIWQCNLCQNLEVIGSLKDLLSQKFSTNNYFLFRHGHSLRQVKNLALCWPEKIYCPLTKRGEEEVREASKKLKNKKIDLIFSSDLLRTKQTAEILAKETGTKIIFDKRLREYNVGIFNGKEPKLAWEYLEKKENLILAEPPKGESLMEIRKRMYDFFEDKNEKYQGKNILIISHELPLTILEESLRGWSLEKVLEWRKEKKIKVIKTGQFRKIEFKTLSFNEKMELDFHRPYIDEVEFHCPKCRKMMERVPEVIDCWFDSGAMPFAQGNFPFASASAKASAGKRNQKLKPPELFPAEYISEAIDQTRGWFYTLLAISTLLGFGASYRNVISLGHVLDEKGEKMSKSKGNAVSPWYIVEKYGADNTRWYFYTINQPGDSKLFSEKDIQDSFKKFIMNFWNCFLFFTTYAPRPWELSYGLKSRNVLDRWIISTLNKLILDVTNSLDKYDVTSAARLIENFVINDLSLWYIRRSRRRFHPVVEQSSLRGKKTIEDFEEASNTLSYVLLTLSKLTAPFTPFLAEEIYQKLQKSRASKIKPLTSIHFEDWPKANRKLIDKKLAQNMERARETVALVLAKRSKAKIKVRQPLNKLQIMNYELKKEPELLELIKAEVNVKEITFGKTLKLDTKITSKLKEEGIIREVIRNIQEMRKEAGFKPKDKILVRCSSSPNLDEILMKNKDFILKEARISDFASPKEPKQFFDIEKEVKVDQEKLLLGIKKI